MEVARQQRQAKVRRVLAFRGVYGPLVVVEGEGLSMYEIVLIGEEELVGEVVAIRGNRAYVQVYEDTTGIGPGDRAVATGEMLSAELGPGLLGSIYDGLQRNETEMFNLTRDIFVKRGVKVKALDRSKKWAFEKTRELKIGDKVSPGDVIGYVQEGRAITHKVMVPPGVSGELKWIASDGDYVVEDTIALVESERGVYEVKLYQTWPVRMPRPFKQRLEPTEPLVTGIRVIDYLFPLAKGGKAAIPGGFGTGKTVLLQELAKWSNVDVVVFVGCGERGNEMSDALTSFKKLVDPRRGIPMLERSIFIANTSNMPVIAREASVLLGATLAEYYRDMGYDVLLVADSTSRWAEAMREIAGRMEELPAEEGYPGYLASRLAEFYERAGRVVALGKPERVGSVTVVGAVSPPGGDFSEPVTRATMRLIHSLYALDYWLATRRHFPAINWLLSYSLYVPYVGEWWSKLTGGSWARHREEMLRVLQREAELQDVVRVVGPDALPEEDKLVLEIARMIRESFLQQSAYDPSDAYSPPEKTALLARAVMEFYERSRRALRSGVRVSEIRELKSRAFIAKLKFYAGDEFRKAYETLAETMREEFGEAV
ncbi:MAG: V-type ATP synthase subunit A [Acidilobaceae archaeon]